MTKEYLKDYPNKVNVIIEISKGESEVKYEIDKNSGLITVDRFLDAPMYYPQNYGYIENTLADDGDALDAMLICKAVHIGVLVKSRPIGVMQMEDEAGIDDKIILVPDYHLDSRSVHIEDIGQIDLKTKQCIQHFFEHYKKLDTNKWSKVNKWLGPEEAKKIIQKCIIKTNL